MKKILNRTKHFNNGGILMPFLTSLFLFAFFLSYGMAQESTIVSGGERKTGSIAGRVTAAQTGDPLEIASVIISGTIFGAATDSSGRYEIRNVPIGLYTIRVSYLGYQTKNIQSVKVLPDTTITIDIQLNELNLVVQEIVVQASRPQMNLDKTASVSLRGGKGGEVAYIIEGIPITGDLPNPDFNTEEYSYIQENRFLTVPQSPVSTFGADVDGASYANARRFIMQNQIPPPDAIRIEELINYFPYDYPKPKGPHPLAVHIEHGICDWNPDHELVMIGMKGTTLDEKEQKPSNLVFLIDVSGSMASPDKLPLLKSAFRMLVTNLNPEDVISIVVYAGKAGLVLPATKGSDKQTILAAIDKLEAGGSTAGGEGIELAYKVAREELIKDGNNRVILATDGDFNVGISNTGDLVRFIEKQKDQGIFLTVLGFGTGNYKDSRMQELANKGNGTHAYIDNIMEAKKVLVNELTSTLFTIAKDVKIQVEFNPNRVQAYRLIGYENRHLKREDFRDDTKDAGEIGSGHTVTAIYEIIPAGSGEYPVSDTLKYQKVISNSSDELLTVKIRYKKPNEDTGIEFNESVTGTAKQVDKTSETFRFISSVTEFGMILRRSEFKGNSNWDRLIELATESVGSDPFGYRAEFLMVVKRARELASNRNELGMK